MKTFGKIMVGAYKVGIALTTIGYVGAVIAITVLKKRERAVFGRGGVQK